MRLSLYMTFVAVAALAQVACMSSDLSTDGVQMPDSAWDTGFDGDVQTGVDTSDGTDTGSAERLASYLALSGAARITAGELVAADSTLALALLDGTGTGPALCEVQLVPEVLEALVLPVDAQLWGLWTVQLPVDTAACGATELPAQFNLGIGALDPLLTAALGGAGVDASTAAQTTYGLYFQADAASPIFVFGTATAGVDVPADALADGDYMLQTLHLLPL